MSDTPKYPNVIVPLSGEDSNGFVIIGRVSGALRRNGVSRESIAEFQKEAMAEDYNGLLQTCMAWVSVS